jgi:hypothetical protein
MSMTASELLAELNAAGASVQVQPDRSLRCANVPTELVAELRRLQEIVVRELLGEHEGPPRPTNPSAKACSRCSHEIDTHYPAHIWSCQHCGCSQWRKRPGDKGIRVQNMGDETDPFWSEFRICRCGHDDIYHKKTETGMTPCMARAASICDCPAYLKPKAAKAPKKAKQRNLFGDDHHEQPGQHA